MLNTFVNKGDTLFYLSNYVLACRIFFPTENGSYQCELQSKHSVELSGLIFDLQ